ncbi:hypothetical protein Hbl1158_05590 [Halobaculum sp. CBA1158]|uniref:hypothetical protein n=1 Tax=Halobaculum sp. CBA1158 TaxID=2904243 RepID=UPI001F41958D|nr:hypothetical protein [Halobaculum sp. CBA1158]UIP00829.1 hypothetical protein Hbl1158_05590 [Halobaculum sp. CBA1158]
MTSDPGGDADADADSDADVDVAAGADADADSDADVDVAAGADAGGPDGVGADAVRASLRALALDDAPAIGASGGDADAEGGDRNPTVDRSRVEQRRLVADAEAAMSSVERAAAFADSGGFDGVRELVGDGTGVDDTLRRRAERVLDGLAAYRTAHREAVGTRAVHFHPGHDSHMPCGEQAGGNR